MINDRRIIYFDYLRILALYGVLIIHVCAGKYYEVDTTTFSWQALAFYEVIARFCVPIFVMISGALFLDDDKLGTIRKLYFHNIKRLLIAFLLWSLSYTVVCEIIIPIYHKEDLNIKVIRQEFLYGHYHLWFIFMIVGLYILTPIFRTITKDKKITEYFLALGIFFGFLLDQIGNLPCMGFVITIRGKMFLDGFSGYCVYYVLGHYLNKYEFSVKLRKLIYAIGTISTVFVVVFQGIVSFRKGEPFHQLSDYLTINTLILSTTIFIMFKHMEFKYNSMINALAELSFCAYLVHEFVNMIILRIINPLSFCVLVSVPVLSLIILIVSFALSYLLKKVPIVGKWGT